MSDNDMSGVQWGIPVSPEVYERLVAMGAFKDGVLNFDNVDQSEIDAMMDEFMKARFGPEYGYSRD